MTEIEVSEIEFKKLPQSDQNWIVLQTCNRFEVYFSGTKESEGRAEAKKVLLDWFGPQTAQHLISESYVNTLIHLFKVSSWSERSETIGSQD